MTEEAAEAVALRAVAFIVAEDDRLMRFLAASGGELGDLKDRLRERGFLVGVLDFILSEDAMVVELAEQAAFAPETPFNAREFLAR